MRLLPLLSALTAAALSAAAAQWPQFRGPQGMGIAADGPLPARLSVEENLIWKTEVPPGHSSPVLSETAIFLTAYEGETLLTMALDRASGEILWKREAPRPRREPFQGIHGPATPSPVTDGANVYVFFGDFGVLSYDAQGNERWRRPLGPFDNINGHGSSPILADGKLILVCDQQVDSYLLALDAADGSVVWKTARPEVTRGYGTAGVFHPPKGKPQVVVPGAYRVLAYDLESGEKLWWVNGFAWQLKSVPVFDADTIYINGWESGGDPGQQSNTVPFAQMLAEHDADGDGKLSRAESPNKRLTRDDPWSEADLDRDGLLGERDWYFYAARRAPVNNLVAIRPGNRRGDISADGVLWRYAKSLPNTPSPLLYRGMIYLIKDGGIFSSIDPADGSPKLVARLRGAIDQYWASPVAGDGKIYTVSAGCAVSAVTPGASWKAADAGSFDDSCFATPALADGRFYLRTLSALYVFGAR